MAQTDGRRRYSSIEDEEIEIKPSTELIPDEYERTTNKNVLVELICKPTDEYIEDLVQELTHLGYSINKTTDKINNINDWISNFVERVNDKITQGNYDGLIMIFAKVSLKNDVLKTIWGNFTSAKCPALKNKPKIFIFQIAKRGMAADTSVMQTGLPTAYDTPSEADILIVYDKISSASSNDFLDNFHDHIKEYGHQEDIINLVSLSIGSETRPLVISTMTRKFFFTLNEYRGHHHNINASHAKIKENLEKIIKFVENMPDHKSTDKDKSIMSSFRKTINSFRHKSQHGKGSDNGNNKAQGSRKDEPQIPEVKKEIFVDKAVAGPSKEKPKALKPPAEPIAIPPTRSPTRKTSLPVSPSKKNLPRTRFPSNSYGSKEDLPTKPPWK